MTRKIFAFAIATGLLAASAISASAENCGSDTTNNWGFRSSSCSSSDFSNNRKGGTNGKSDAALGYSGGKAAGQQ